MRKPDPEKKELLLQAAERLFLHYGIARVTIEQITSDAGVGKGTFYLFFKNKEDILGCIGLEHFKAGLLEIRLKLSNINKTEEKLKELLLMKPLLVYQFVTNFPHGSDMLDYLDFHFIEKQGYSAVVEQYYLLFKEIFQEGIKVGAFKIYDVEQLIQHICLMSTAFNPPYCIINNPEDLKQQIDLYTATILAFIKS